MAGHDIPPDGSNSVNAVHEGPKAMQPTLDKITNSVAVAGAASPFWLPSLQDVSNTASLLLPIISVAWLVYQAIEKIVRKKRD